MAFRTVVPLENAVLEFRGLSPKQIADLLEEASALGRRGTVRNCPLANYCHKTYGGTFVVGKKHIYRERVMHGNKMALEKIDTPANMVAFIAQFDLGNYPKLELPPSPPRKRDPNRNRATGPGFKKKRYPRNTRYSIAQEAGRFAES